MSCSIICGVFATAEPIGKQVLPVCWSHMKWTRDTTKDTTNSLKVSFLGHMGETSVRLHSMTPQEYHKGHHKSAYKHLNSIAVYNSSAKNQKWICQMEKNSNSTQIFSPGIGHLALKHWFTIVNMYPKWRQKVSVSYQK